MLFIKKAHGGYLRRQSGMTLVEVLIALAIMGFTVVFVGALYTALKATPVHEENVKAEALAKSCVECIKAQDYIDCTDSNCPSYDACADSMNDGYEVVYYITPLQITENQTPRDRGIQVINVEVKKANKQSALIKLTGFKLKQ